MHVSFCFTGYFSNRTWLYLVIYKSGCDSELLDEFITCHKPQDMPLHSVHSDGTNKLSQQKIGTSALRSINYSEKCVSQQLVPFQGGEFLWPKCLPFRSLFKALQNHFNFLISIFPFDFHALLGDWILSHQAVHENQKEKYWLESTVLVPYTYTTGAPFTNMVEPNMDKKSHTQ